MRDTARQWCVLFYFLCVCERGMNTVIDVDNDYYFFLGLIWKVFDLVILPKILPNSMIQMFVILIFRRDALRQIPSFRVIHIPNVLLVLVY